MPCRREPTHLVRNGGQLEPLLLVQGLLPRKNVLVEVILQLLVGHIDAKLLKAVVLKVLKAENVEDANLPG